MRNLINTGQSPLESNLSETLSGSSSTPIARINLEGLSSQHLKMLWYGIGANSPVICDSEAGASCIANTEGGARELFRNSPIPSLHDPPETSNRLLTIDLISATIKDKLSDMRN